MKRVVMVEQRSAECDRHGPCLDVSARSRHRKFFLSAIRIVDYSRIRLPIIGSKVLAWVESQNEYAPAIPSR
jgi:hypothetical protein